MFLISDKTENGFNKIVIANMTTGAYAEVIPSCGAILHAFGIKKGPVQLNIIDSYQSATEFRDSVTALGFKGSKLSPFVCRLKNGAYQFGDKQYTIEKFYLGANAIHGLLYDACFSLQSIKVEDSAAAIELLYSYPATDKGYPFPFDCSITYQLEKDGRLNVQTRIINTGQGRLPITDGWHPYFKLGESINSLQLEFQSKEMVLFDDELIPTGKAAPYEEFGSLKLLGDQFFDNCFLLNFTECQPLCVLRNNTDGYQLEIYPDPSYPYLQIYTPAHRNSIAIENLSAAPDAFNNGMGLITLAPTEKAAFSTAYKISFLP